MIDANNPEINVDELMQKIREEVAIRQSSVRSENEEWGVVAGTGVENLSNIFNHINALLNNAEFKSQVRNQWPRKLERFPLNLTRGLQKIALKAYNFLLKEQRAVNFSLIEALRQSLALNQQLLNQVTALQIRLNGVSERLNATDERTDGLLNGVSERLNATDERTDERLNGVSERLNATDERTDERLNGVSERLNATDERLNGVSERLNATDEQLNGVSERLNATDERLNGVSERLNITIDKSEVLKNLPNVLEVTEESYINSAISLSLIPIKDTYKYEQPDLFYYWFENVFYNAEIVQEKQKNYLQFIDEKLSRKHFFLDVGCGRGEFLINLRANNIPCIGVDLNKLEVSLLKERELDVVCSDLLEYLKKTEDTFSGISMFQVIEHLNIDYINSFLAMAYSKIVPNGVLMIETINPHSLYALSNFFQDYTHIKPIPPEMIKFLLEWYGFKNIKIIYSSLVPEPSRIFQDKRMNYQDYAVIGYKL